MRPAFSTYARPESEETYALELQIEGMRCASCAFKIQQALEKEGAQKARVDLVSGQASVVWAGAASKADVFAEKISELGYTPRPFGVANDSGEDSVDALAKRAILAGFATALVMVLGHFWPEQVWLMAGLTLFTLLYAGQPFLLAAFRALRHGRANMDVPISLALLLTTGLSFFEVTQFGTLTYFDSVVMLIYVLLLGRYLDAKTRGRAKEAATKLLALFTGAATVEEEGRTRPVPIRDLKPGMVLLVAAGEKIAADGIVSQGSSQIDLSIITGETLPEMASPGTTVFAGTVNLDAPLHVRITAASGQTLLGEVIRLMRKAEQGQARFVRFADRVARLYTPIVLGLALAAFLGWWLGMGLSWPEALIIAASVLIITCPCAMGLAVPTVQVLASSKLFHKGTLLKSADALERLAEVDTVVFDKTGTLTEGQPRLVNRADLSTEELKLAASLASNSQHPLSRAVVAAYGDGPLYALDVAEYPGEGLEASVNGQPVRLGRRTWCGPTSFPADDYLELWLRVGYTPPRRIAFEDPLREDAVAVMNELRKEGLSLGLLSGDRASVVQTVARRLGLTDAHAEVSPTEKFESVRSLESRGHKVLMVGDGLNDAAALSAASVSASPSSALDITQNAADLIFQGTKLEPVLDLVRTARRTQKLVKQNMLLALLYNVVAVPLALSGLVSPPIAAAAMSLSSITVVLNAQRLRTR